MASEKRSIDIYTDGACKGNPGPGGYGVAIPELNIGFSGGVSHTTNSRMEIQAVYRALTWASAEVIKEHGIHHIQILSDSDYALKGAQKLQKRNTNLDYWELTDEALAKLKALGVTLTFTWVKGHADNAGNKLADKLASNAAIDGQGGYFLLTDLKTNLLSAPKVAPLPAIQAAKSTLPLTQAECDAWRRVPGSFEDMVRAIWEAGKSGHRLPPM